MSAKKLAFNIKSVAIVGAGPSGVAAAKYLLAEKHFDRIEIFEQRNNVGGIWNYTPDDNLAKAEAQAQTIPKTSPDAAVEKPVWRSKMAEYASVDVTRREATFPSALYDDLESNIPKELMQYPDYPFNEQLQLFPGRQEVLKYLEEYAHTVRHLIRFQTQVYDIRQPAQGSWIVRFRDLERGEEMEESYNAVLVASGHYDVSYVPDIEGLREWNEKYPGTVSHSKLYRRPDGYRDKVTWTTADTHVIKIVTENKN
ncbi:MAG: hypothetical protein M1822_008262 [Bathelium mastoideum]|nr:MAG: hypothetical protein M1822_008262 [Bathelium mastoideum]